MSNLDNESKKEKKKELNCTVEKMFGFNVSINDFIKNNCSKVSIIPKYSKKVANSNLNIINSSEKNAPSKESTLNLKDMKEFLTYHIKNYRNFYSERF